MATWSLQDARNRFSAVVEAAGEEPQTVTRHGKPAVVILNAAEYARLQRLDQFDVPSFTEHLLAMPTDDGTFERLDGTLRVPEF